MIQIFSLFLLGTLLTSCVTGPQMPKATETIQYQGHGAEAVDSKVVQKFAPPALPRATSRFVQNHLEINSPGMGLLSPDGKQMYFSWSVTGVSQIWKADGPLRFPEQMTSGSDSTSVLDITPDGKYLIVSRDQAGEENPGLFLLPATGGPLVEVQHKKGVRSFFVWVANDSNEIFYLANDLKPDSYALYSYKINSGQKELLFSEPGLWFVADVWGDHHFLFGKSTGARSREYYFWNPTDKKLVPVIGQGEKEEYDVKFGKGPEHYFVRTNKFGEFSRLYEFQSGQFTPITPDVKKEIDGFTIDHRRYRMYISWNNDGLSNLEVRDPHSLKIIPMPQFQKGTQVYSGRPSRFGRYITIGIENGLAPRTSYVYDWKEAKLTQWVKPSAPEVEFQRFVETNHENYLAADGTKIPMLVTRPKQCSDNLCPVVVHFHGGPEGQSRPGFNKLAQIFAGSGFIFVEPNVRGSEGYGKSWLNSDNGPKRLDVIADIEDCAKHIRSKWAKNGQTPKVGVMGWSYGGYSTLVAMTKFAGSYDAGVSLVGMSNLKSFLLNTAPYRRPLRVTEYGDPEKDASALMALSPTSYLDKINGPLMVIQGVSDPRVPVGEAIQIHELLKNRKIDSPLILFSDEGHGSQKRDNRVLEIGNTLLFFQRHLQK